MEGLGFGFCYVRRFTFHLIYHLFVGFSAVLMKVGWWKAIKQRFCTVSSLPHEIIEIILSRLPVKDLLRYRVVCKQWKATISDPTFAEMHLQHNKSNKNLLAWENLHGYNPGLHVAELRNNSIELVSEIKHSREYALKFNNSTLCSCDGLYLKYFSRGEEEEGKHVKCVLWNPSCRMYRELYCPPSVDVLSGRTVYAMYYDPLMKDHKIVIADMDHYAVYSCGDNKWGVVKEMNGFLGDHCLDRGVFVNGSIYWVVIDADYRFREVICFDCKDESFKRLPLPNLRNFDEYHFQLTSFGGQLCLFIGEWESYRLKIMKKVDGNDEWMESNEESLCECRSEYHAEPVCEVSENELLFHVMRRREMVYLVYDKSKNAVVEIHNKHPTSSFIPPVSHLENLLLL